MDFDIREEKNKMNINKQKEKENFLLNLKKKLIWSASLFGVMFFLEFICILVSSIMAPPNVPGILIFIAILLPITFIPFVIWMVFHISIIIKLSFYEYKSSSKYNDGRIITIVFLILGIFWFIFFIFLLIGIIMSFIFISKERKEITTTEEIKNVETTNDNKIDIFGSN